MRTQESREDYLESILVLSKQQPMVRSVDVANHMGFSKPSVSIAVANLKNALLLSVDENGALILTDAGRALAEQVYERHNMLTEWLMRLGVDHDVAAADACRIEHVISQMSFEKIKQHVEQMSDRL